MKAGAMSLEQRVLFEEMAVWYNDIVINHDKVRLNKYYNEFYLFVK